MVCFQGKEDEYSVLKTINDIKLIACFVFSVCMCTHYYTHTSPLTPYTYTHTHTHTPHPSLTHRLQKALRDFNKQVDKLSGSSQLGGAWDSSLINQIDRSLGEMKRTLSSSSSSGGGGTSNQLCFCHLGGPASILKMLLLCSDVTSPSNGGGSGCGQGRGKPPLPEK